MTKARPIALPLLALALAGAACQVPRAWGEGVGLQANFLGGGRVLDHDSYDAQLVAGVELATRDPELGWGYELGGLYGSEETDVPAGELEGEFAEVYLGLRRDWKPADSPLRPYAGAGGAWMKTTNRLRSSGPTSEFDDRGGGAYLHGGLLWSLGRFDFDRGTEILLGFDLRGVIGDDYDYGQAALVLGFGR